jgi:hypothetical protein
VTVELKDRGGCGAVVPASQEGGQETESKDIHIPEDFGLQEELGLRTTA